MRSWGSGDLSFFSLFFPCIVRPCVWTGPQVNVSGPAEQDLNHRRWFHRETMRETSELSEQHEAPHARLSSESEKEFLIWQSGRATQLCAAMNNGNTLAKTRGGSGPCHPPLLCSLVCFYDVSRKRKGIFVKRVKGISCETRWTCIKTQEWKDVCSSALSCFGPFPPSLSLPLSVWPLLSLHLPFLALKSLQALLESTGRVGKCPVSCEVSRLEVPTRKHARYAGLKHKQKFLILNQKRHQKEVKTRSPERVPPSVTDGHNRFSVARVSTRVVSFQKGHKNLSVN